jgi:hypothetical protein
MLLRIDRQGNVVCLYDETIDVAVLGPMSVRRASHVEPDETGQWHADLAPVGGPRLGPLCGIPHNGPCVAKVVMWRPTQLS